MAIDPKTWIDRQAINAINKASAWTWKGYEQVAFLSNAELMKLQGRPENTQQTQVSWPRLWDASYWWPTSWGGSFIKSQSGNTGVNSLQVRDAQGNLITNTVWWRSVMSDNKKSILPWMLPSTGATAQANWTKDNSAVIDANGAVTNTLPQGQDASLPAPTVATPNQPVILRQTTKPQVGYQPVDHTDINNMDLVGLRDYTRSLQYDQAQGKTLTKEQTLKLQRAMDRANELSAPQSQVATGALDQLVTWQQQQKEQVKTELQAQDQQQYQATQQLEQAKLESIKAENAKAEEKQKNTLGYILGAQGAWTSSFGAEKINEITWYFNAQNQLAILESTASLEKLRAEQAGATRQELAKYDDQIFKLQEAKAKYQVESAMKVDEYNQEQAQNAEKSLQNILDVAIAQEANKIPLSDAEKAQVQAYWQLLIDEKGWINKEMLDIIPARLRNQALIAWSAIKWAIPKEPKTLNTDWGAFVYDYATQTRKKLAGSTEEKKGNWTQLDDWTLLNKDTGETKVVTGTGTIQTAIQKAVEACKTGAQCGRFVNEVWKQAGITLWIGDSYESKVNAVNKIGQAMNANEVWAWSIFTYPTGTKFWHIGIVTWVNDDGTINIMDYNYGNDEQKRERMNVSPSEIFNLKWVISKPIITNDNVPQATKPLTDKQFTQSNQVITSFKSDPQVKAFEESFSQWVNLLSSLNDVSWPWDTAAVYQFMKSLDPQSVVRESEFDLAANSAGVASRIGNMFQRLSEWKVLTEEQRKAFWDLAKQFIKNKAKIYQTKYDDWVRRLEKQWIDTSVFPTNIASQIDQYLWDQKTTQAITESDPTDDYLTSLNLNG